jgi:hypothetical protein
MLDKLIKKLEKAGKIRKQKVGFVQDQVITICDQLKNLKYAKALPNAFTEHGDREK